MSFDRSAFCRRAARWTAFAMGCLLCFTAFGPAVSRAQTPQAAVAPAAGTGLLSPSEVEKLLPTSAYFKGQSAPLQLRNAAAFRTTGGAVLWVSLVDTSGYSTGVRERYQFYLVTEAPLVFGDATLDAGAYGAGFLADGSAVVMDIGGKEIRHTVLGTDAAMRRPRPLQLVRDGAGLRLYLGKQYVSLLLK